MRLRIKSKILAPIYAKNYDIVLIPTSEVSKMVEKEDRRISKKSVRAMLTWSHSTFKTFMLHKAHISNPWLLLTPRSRFIQ